MTPVGLALSRVGLSHIWRYIQSSVDRVIGKAENLEFSHSKWSKQWAVATPKGAVGQALTDDSLRLCLLQRASQSVPPAPSPVSPLSSHNLIHPAPPAPPLHSVSTSAVRTVQDWCHPCAVLHTLVFLLSWNDKLFSGLLSGVRTVPCLPSVRLNPTGPSTWPGTSPCTTRIHELILLFYYKAKREQDPKKEEFWTSSLSFLINRMEIMTQWFTKLCVFF